MSYVEELRAAVKAMEKPKCATAQKRVLIAATLPPLVENRAFMLPEAQQRLDAIIATQTSYEQVLSHMLLLLRDTSSVAQEDAKDALLETVEQLRQWQEALHRQSLKRLQLLV